MRRLCSPIAFLAAAVLLAACSRPALERGPSVSRDTLPNGAVLLRYGPLPAGGVILAEADLRLGTVDGDPNLIFGDVRGVEAGSDGTIYVLDYQASEVRAFGPDGRFLRTVASRGAGPGEITEANGMVLVGDSVLWIQDHGKWMMIGVSTDGVELRRFPMAVRSYGYVWSGTVDHAGRVWKERAHSNAPREYPPREGLTEGAGSLFYVFYDPDTDVADSIPLGPTLYRSMVSRNSRGGYSYYSIPFDPRPITVVDPGGGIWRTGGAEYRVMQIGESGDTALVLESATPGPPVTAADRAGFVERLVERDPGERRVAEEITTLIPETKPAIARLVVDDDGRLWVQRAGLDEANPQFDLFDRDGTYHGTVELGFRPEAYGPLSIRHGRVYGVVRDSLDVPFVVRSRPVRAAGR